MGLYRRVGEVEALGDLGVAQPRCEEGEHLDMAVKRTGDSQTDTINRAIQVYSYLTDITETSGTLYVRDAGTDELERLHII